MPHALPQGQNNPKVCPYGLYCEQLSGTAFTAPRHANQRSWLYRIKPSVTHQPFHPLNFPVNTLISDFANAVITPNQLRWRPFQVPRDPVDFVQGLFTICGSGRCGNGTPAAYPDTVHSAAAKSGYAIHVYTASASMSDCCLANADGDLLIVPQLGALRITTEFGLLDVAPGEIVVVQRGMRFSVSLHSEQARGYVLEVFGGHFTLPDLGPIGAYERNTMSRLATIHVVQGRMGLLLRVILSPRWLGLRIERFPRALW